MAEKLLNPAGWALYRQHRDILDSLKGPVDFTWMSTQNPLGARGLQFAKASVFGFLAQQKKYDPAYTP